MLSLALFVTHFFVLYCWKIPWLALSACFTPLISYRPTQTYYTSTLWCHDLISTIYSQLVYISTLSDLMEVLLIVLETVKAVVRCLNHYTRDREFEGQGLPWFNISYFIDASVQLKIKICTVYFLCFLFEWCQLKHLQCCSFCFSGCFPPSGSPTSIPTPSTYTPPTTAATPSTSNLFSHSATNLSLLVSLPPAARLRRGNPLSTNKDRALIRSGVSAWVCVCEMYAHDTYSGSNVLLVPENDMEKNWDKQWESVCIYYCTAKNWS